MHCAARRKDRRFVLVVYNLQGVSFLLPPPVYAFTITIPKLNQGKPHSASQHETSPPRNNKRKKITNISLLQGEAQWC